MQKTEPDCVIRFGVLELDPRTGELRSKGSKVKLQEQPLQILLAVLEKPGDLVTREELRAKLWPADTFVDFDHGLNAAVKRLRDALGDTAENPRYIETLPRHGYRFIAPVQRTTPANLQLLMPAVIRSRWLVAAGCIVLLLITAAPYLLRRQANKTVQPDRRVMLAVLPFESLDEPSHGDATDMQIEGDVLIRLSIKGGTV